MARSITVIPANENNINEAIFNIPRKKMCAYCRVSTDYEEQLSSYDAQVQYYTNYITNHPDYDFVCVYADEGISGTSTKKREQFNKMIEDCKSGKIDIIITKSISRFARNTLDALNYVRMLKDLGIGIIFEKEAINTLDSKGEVLLTILSSLAQDESRSISENCTWGYRRKFEQGKVIINHTKFIGYDKDADGNLIINGEQAKIVKRIFAEFLNLKVQNYFFSFIMGNSIV
jgi:DNA invertase Pin-like site-specific DNA recombinase